MESLILVYTLFFIGRVLSEGCLQLDMYSFDKIVSKFDAALISYDDDYPFGTRHAMFKAICEDIEFPSNILVAEVYVNHEDEKRNEDLAKRNMINRFPKTILYIKGKDPIEFKASREFSFNPINLRKFISKHTKTYIPLPGCLKEFDHLAKGFSKLDDNEKRRILSKAESMEKTLETKSQKKSAKKYIVTMKRILENGTSILDSEKTRINRLLREELGMRKKTEFRRTLNVLYSFRTHDEL